MNTSSSSSFCCDIQELGDCYSAIWLSGKCNGKHPSVYIKKVHLILLLTLRDISTTIFWLQQQQQQQQQQLFFHIFTFKKKANWNKSPYICITDVHRYILLM